MGWNAETSETGSFDDSSNYGSGYEHGYGGFGWRPDVNVSGSGASSNSQSQDRSRSHQGLRVKNPFGRGVHFDPPVIRERGRGRERSRSRSSGRGLEVDVDGKGSLGLNTEGGSGETWDADEEEGYRYTDHLKINNGPVLREMQSFESGLTARADPLPRQATDTKGKDREDLSIGASKAIPESEPEFDAVIVSAAVDGYESSGSSASGSAFPPSTPVPTRQTLPIHIPHTSVSTSATMFSQETQSPSLETASHSRYSTQVFDVLQSYRGIPLLDKLSEDTEFPETTVIRLSARNELNAAPKDDPRFVMWGELWNGFSPSEEDGASVDVNASIGGASRLTSSGVGAETVSNHGSMIVQGPTDQSLGSKKGKKGSISLVRPATASLTTLSAVSLVSSTHSVPSRSTNSKTDGQPPPSSHLGRPLNGEAPRKVLIAATIERWIAQLTSELNYDELLIFFLTYRTYVSAVDLCHLLICRFHWALESSSSSPPSASGSARSSYRFSSNSGTANGSIFGNNLTIKDSLNNDDMVKRIVRVRTFIAIRYWLLTFFAIDFVPNRELRVLFGNWLNTLAKDPTLHGKKDIMVCPSLPCGAH
jgi:GDP/GTP exchange factor required for growth at low temperature